MNGNARSAAGAMARYFLERAKTAPEGPPAAQTEQRAALYREYLTKPAGPLYGAALAGEFPPVETVCRQPDGVLRLKIDGEFSYGLMRLDYLLLHIEAAREVHLEITSGGGDSNDAVMLWEALHDKCSVATATGKCWSGGTILLCAAPVRRVAADCTLMVHVPHLFIAGNSARLREAARCLDATTARLAAIYGERVAPEIVAKWLSGPDFWLSAQETVACGLATEICGTPAARSDGG